ncbi:MAG TPA: PhzF family phenazine biosynthesis protein [Candidatus Didemnitutus sp.]|nr:PhzF family phenazine biosynthesis protein [Candidatus Didemnitutus sp.]
MKLPLYWIDAFTKTVFAGSPAAVVPLAAWPADEVMQQIAFENGLAETAFFVRTGPDRLHLRWFTPAFEMDLCGHATLASGHVVFRELGQGGDRITFDSRSGPLVVTRKPHGLLELDFPARPPRPVSVPEQLARGLGAAPQLILKSRDYFCVYGTEEEVRALKPDMATLAIFEDTVGIIVTAPGRNSDFVSRFFAPRAGVPEDPVTGSAHCTLVPYWAERLGKTKLHARQVSPRGGELFCELLRAKPGQGDDRVTMAGHAKLYLRGEIEI